MAIYAATVFLSAFLLFLIQPLIAKYILPWFGGSPSVWTTCLLFFQVVLTAGYGYAHLLASRISRRLQVAITLGLLVLTIAWLPITPSRAWIPESVNAPTWHIFRLLFACVGACYFLLSSMGPLLQAWFSRIWPNSSPYRLYTLSNLGSLLAIISYPLIIEPNLALGFQTQFWSFLYLIFASLCTTCAFKLWKNRDIPTGVPLQPVAAKSQLPRQASPWMWLLLPALSSTMLLATTNQLCLDVASVPLLWLLPMGIYLLSFILCFHSERWYSRIGYGIALAVALIQTCMVLYRGVYIALPLQIASYSFTLFVCCMICHGELVRRKPAPDYLTSFYLLISAGGALGGVFVNLLAPQIFKGYWEFQMGLIGTAFIYLVILFRNPNGRLFAGRPFWAWTLLHIAFLALVLSLGIHIRTSLLDAVIVKRNFFGVLRILDDDKNNPQERHTTLMHGRIVHGYQYADEEKRYWPTSYFGPTSGIGIAIRFHPRRLDPAQRNLRIGVVGLGTGTLSAYGDYGDYFRFYEINPDVLQFSGKYFTYLKDSAARIDIALGDARILMEREKSRGESGRYDVLAIDAFSSDAIPVHLLTRECYEIYQYQLKPDGILALHVSNRYFNLNPVVRSLARSDIRNGVQALRIEDEGSHLQGTDSTSWILITANRDFLANQKVQSAVAPWDAKDGMDLLFTDDYSNLFRLLR
jgi:hypothetical protein